MNQVLSWLSGGDLRSDGMANEVADFVLENPTAFEDLFAGLSETNDLVRGRAADAIEKVSRSRPDMLLDHLPEMINLSREEKVPLVKMHLAMIFGHLAVYPELVGQLKAVLIFLLEDESVFTRSWAIVSLCIIARKYPQECQDILEHLVPLQGDQSIAIRSRVKKAINLLADPNAKFPKGWIKSEHLQGVIGK
jgi:HEAT repeat protein